LEFSLAAGLPDRRFCEPANGLDQHSRLLLLVFGLVYLITNQFP
jgi:hypothetical protein